MILRRSTVLAAALAALIVIVGLAARALTPAGTSISAKATANYKNSAGVSMPSATSNTVSVTVGQVGGVQIALPGGPTQDLTVGLTGGVAVKVTNSGNGSDNYTLSASSNEPRVTVKIVKDANADGALQDTEASSAAVTSTGAVAGGDSSDLIVVLTPEADAGAGLSADITITAKSSFDAAKTTTATCKVTFAESKYIRSWLINGYYSNTVKAEILTKDYLGGEADVVPKDGDQTAGVTWRKLDSSTDKVDLLPSFPAASYCAAYAFTYVYAPADVNGEIRLGSDDGNAVWVNGQSVYANNSFRGYIEDQDTAPISLKAGWNNLLVKISQKDGGWGFSARICDSAGNSIPGVIYSTIPPTDIDTTPPVISSVEVSGITTTSATITWTTDEAGSTDVLYGVASTSEKKHSNTTSATQHTATLSALTPGTTYIFKASSTDKAGNTAVSSQLQFTTTAPPATSVNYIRDWLLNGHYLNSDRATILSKDYLGMETLTAPKAGDVEGGKTWAIRRSTTDKVDLVSVFGSQSYAVAYACAYINSPVTVDALLKIGSDDGVKVWLNGENVWTKSVFRGYQVDQDVVPVTLKAGWNRLLIKISQKSGGWSFSVRVTNTAGGSLSGVTAAVDTGDIAPPVISNLKVTSVNTTEAVIDWDTNEPATTELGYGVADISEQAYGDPTPVTHHTVKLTNLKSATVYKFKAYSADIQNNVAESTVQTFTTVADAQEPVSYVTTWLTNGNYANSSSLTRLSQAYISNEKSTYPYTGYSSNSKPWITPKVDTSIGKVDFASTYGNPTACAGYAHVYVYTPTADVLNVFAGSDDGIKVWFDGYVVWNNDVYRSFKQDQDQFQINPGFAGWHRMMVKVSQNTGEWGFALRFADSAGNPVPGMEFQVDKPW